MSCLVPFFFFIYVYYLWCFRFDEKHSVLSVFSFFRSWFPSLEGESEVFLWSSRASNQSWKWPSFTSSHLSSLLWPVRFTNQCRRCVESLVPLWSPVGCLTSPVKSQTELFSCPEDLFFQLALKKLLEISHTNTTRVALTEGCGLNAAAVES